VLAGAVAAPALLPWLPARQFYLKGLMTGLVSGILAILFSADSISNLEAMALLLLSMSVSSYAAMNFTGATPFTSPSGVEKEMRRGIPVQILAVLVSIVAWVSAPFIV
jgi:ammonia channel protein AmtB